MRSAHNFVALVLVWGLGCAPAMAGPLVLLDPGHGGTNLGAPGTTIKRHEKQLTLVFARLTAQALRRHLPKARVLLTRDRDRYLTLAQRVRMANKVRAAAFISLHLNACEAHNRKGFSTYLLSRDASDKEAARVAARENLELRPGRDKQRKSPGAARRSAAIRSILTDLRHAAAHAGSAKLAAQVQRSLALARGKKLDRGVRQAAFDVLMGLRMPGVLVELGFIDHAEEGRALNDPKVQRHLADALARGIAAHLTAGK